MKERARGRASFGGIVIFASVSLAVVPKPAHADEGSSPTQGPTKSEAAVARPSGREWLAVPVSGPIIGATNGVMEYPWAVVSDEVGQVGGMTLLIAGDSVSWGSTASVTRCRGGGVCLGARGVF